MLDKKQVKVPHIGWNNLIITNKTGKLLSLGAQDCHGIFLFIPIEPNRKKWRSLCKLLDMGLRSCSDREG